MPRIGPGVVFLAAVATLCALSVTDLLLSSASYREGSTYTEVLVGRERVVLARTVEMRPGDRLLVHEEAHAASERHFASYDLFILPHGAARALLSGEAPPWPPYVHVAGLETRECCIGGLVVFDRPDDEAFHGAPGAQAAERPELLDLVWVLAYQPDLVIPEDEEAFRRFQMDVLHDLDRSPAARLRDPVVFDAAIVRARPALVAGSELAALLAVGAVAAWTVRLWRAPRLDADGGAESLLRAHAAAGAFLARLRDVLAGALVAGGLLVLQMALAAERAKRLGAAGELLAYDPPWTAGDPSFMLYLAAAAAGLYALWHVHRALARWRERSSSSAPLEL